MEPKGVLDLRAGACVRYLHRTDRDGYVFVVTEDLENRIVENEEIEQTRRIKPAR